MRRSLLAALTGALALAACSDQSSKAPTEPKAGGITPNVTSQSDCRRIPNWQPFPFKSVKEQIRGIFPNGDDLRDRAIERAEDIRDLWSDCRAAAARAKVRNFVNFILKKFQAGVLIGGTSEATGKKVGDLINALYLGVGLVDVGSGVFVPGTEKLIKTTSGNAAVRIPSDGFDELTLITIAPLPDNSNPLNTGLTQFPPFFEINAANASNTHVLSNAQKGIVGFCVDDAVIAGISDPQIGHNPVAGAPGFPFEVLDAASFSEYGGLGLNCPTQGNASPSTMIRRRGFQGLAVWAWNAARPLAEAVLLPELLHAAMPPGGSGLGGRTSSFSPFGVVETSSTSS